MIDDLYYIKQMYCRYKCNAKTEKVYVGFDAEVYCSDCYKYITTNYIYDNIPINEEACKLCQIDNFIKELESYNLKIKGD